MEEKNFRKRLTNNWKIADLVPIHGMHLQNNATYRGTVQRLTALNLKRLMLNIYVISVFQKLQGIKTNHTLQPLAHRTSRHSKWSLLLALYKITNVQLVHSANQLANYKQNSHAFYTKKKKGDRRSSVPHMTVVFKCWVDLSFT